MLNPLDMDEVTCVTTNKLTDWWIVYYNQVIMDDPPDEVWMFMKKGMPGDDHNEVGKVKCDGCTKKMCKYDYDRLDQEDT